MKISFEYIFSNYKVFYLFVVILCTAKATIYTRGFNGYTGDILSFSLLLILSLAFILKEKVRFSNKGFAAVITLYLVWYVAQFIKYGGANLSLSIFLFYQLIIAYSIVYVFGEKIFYLFEAIVTKLSIISFFVWAVNLLAPNIVDATIGLISLPIGDNGLIKYNIFLASVLNAQSIFQIDTWFRNPGFSWEPGMNASIVCTAIFINLIINKFRIKNNRNLYWLIAALISSFSTTGYMTFICVILPFYLVNISRKWAVYSLFLFVPIIFYLVQLDFIGEKIINLQSDDESLHNIEKSIRYNEEIGEEQTYVPQRFDGLAFEMMNIAHDPFIGYGVDVNNSFVRSNISDRLALSNGNLKILAQFGLIAGLILFLFYGYTCHYLSKCFRYRGGIFLMMLFLFISISYAFYNVPFYMGAMLFPFFKRSKKI